MKEKIDFVITWVDGNDPKWLEEQRRYLKESDLPGNQKYRYRDMGTLRYWFRAVETYAPWVNRIHFITWGHLPEWLNTDYKKLNIIKHSDYIPNEYLPTFNARVINMNIHRIKELSEQFVLFDDDMFLNDYVTEEFFFKNGLPRGSAILSPIIPENGFAYTLLNNILLINKHFNKQKSIKENFRKFFSFQYGYYLLRNIVFNSFSKVCGLKEFHSANAFLKSTLAEIWEKEETLLDSLSRNRFRAIRDVNQWLIKNWQFMSGKFEPISPKFTKILDIGANNNHILKLLKEKQYKVICINDVRMDFDFEKAKTEIINAFEEKFPQKCRYEL